MKYDDINPKNILYKNRILFLSGDINQERAYDIIPMFMVLDSLGEEPIKLYVDSPGGEMSAGLAIYDAMRFIKAPVYTICIGRAASMAAWILAAGAKGNRIASENAQIMIHQGRTMMGGTFTDLKISMNEFTRMDQRMIDILSKHTGQSQDNIARALERDCWMTPKEAKEFGIIDSIV